MTTDTTTVTKMTNVAYFEYTVLVNRTLLVSFPSPDTDLPSTLVIAKNVQMHASCLQFIICNQLTTNKFRVFAKTKAEM